MNVIMMESAAFQELVGHIEKIAEHIRRYEDRLTVQPQERWLTSKDVTALLGISLRTLQRYRDEGRIPFSLMGRTCRYRLTDVERMMKECSMSGNAERIGELHRQCRFPPYTRRCCPPRSTCTAALPSCLFSLPLP